MKHWIGRSLAAGVAATLSVAAASAADCELAATSPDIPDGATASEETLTAVMQDIKAFQAALEPYRDCLNGIIDDEDTYDVDQRQAALDKYNASVEAEEKMAADWSETVKAFKARQDG